MAKKQKRQVSSGPRAEAFPQPAAPSAPTPAATSYSAGRNRPGEFNPDYTYVIRDLKRIGVLAGTFITLLVVLSFFLR